MFYRIHPIQFDAVSKAYVELKTLWKFSLISTATNNISGEAFLRKNSFKLLSRNEWRTTTIHARIDVWWMVLHCKQSKPSRALYDYHQRKCWTYSDKQITQTCFVHTSQCLWSWTLKSTFSAWLIFPPSKSS